MKHVLRYLTILALMACLPLAAQAVDPEIAYGVGRGGGLWVMDQDGANKTLICEGRVAYPHWSRDGNSAVFVSDGDSDLYRIDLSGGPTGCSDIKLASKCGTFSVTENTLQYLVDLLDGESYGVPDISALVEGLAGPAHWSPVAAEVAVRVNWGLSGNRGVIAVADSWRWNDTLVPIYASAEGVRIGDFAWSPDGSKLAVVEGPIDEVGPYPNAVLKIIDLKDGLAIKEIWLTAALGLDEQGPINTLDWARTEPGGYLMAYTSYVPGSPPHKGGYYVMVTDFGAENPMADQIMGGWSPSWSPDGTHLVLFTSDLNLPRDKGGVIAKVNMATREGTILGGSGPTDWKPGPTTSACETFADCDDGNPCTAHDCVASACTHFPDDSGVCDDGNECTFNDICLNGNCIGTGLEEGALCSSGLCCTGWCQDVCFDHAECYDNDPETNTCLNSGTCAATCEYVGECVQTGDPCASDSDCCSGRCHAVKGVCK